MANYHKRNSIRAVQWDPENAQSFEDIKKLVAENPGLGWKVRDNIIHNCVTIYSFALDVLRIKPYEYLVVGGFTPFVTGYLYSGNNETESDDWLLRIVDGYRAADDDSPRIVFANRRTISVQDFREESEGENKYKWFAATEKQFDKPFSYADFGTRLEEATHGYVKRIQSLIASKDEATVNRIADMLDSMGFDAVTGYFDPKEDERSGEVDSLTGYYYVDI